MKVVILASVLFAVCISSCTSKQALKPAQDSTFVTGGTHAVARPLRYLFAFTSSGVAEKPSDAIKMDTIGLMLFETRRRTGAEQFKKVAGMAVIEAVDYDSLKAIIETGDLFSIDSADLSPRNCPTGELYGLTLQANDFRKPLHIEYSSCSPDFNLITGRQRREGFERLVRWFEMMREKYRPAETKQ